MALSVWTPPAGMFDTPAVEFVEPPEKRFYGIDAGFRDPSGNHIRLTQPLPESAWSDRRSG